MPSPNARCGFGRRSMSKRSGSRNSSGVPVRRSEQHHDRGAAGDVGPGDARVALRVPHHHLHRAVVTQDLFDGGDDQLRFGPQAFVGGAMLHQHEEAVGDEIHRRVAAGEEQQQGHGDELIPAELSRVERRDHRADEIVTRIGLVPLDLEEEILAQGLHRVRVRRRDRLHHGACRARRRNGVADRGPVDARDAEGARDREAFRIEAKISSDQARSIGSSSTRTPSTCALIVVGNGAPRSRTPSNSRLAAMRSSKASTVARIRALSPSIVRPRK